MTASVRAYAFRDAGADPSIAHFAADVGAYLARQPRQLPSRYFYDPLGSALFDAICELPWYRITRAESRLLTAHAKDVLRQLRPLSRIVELGPGSGEKLKLLLTGAGGLAPLDVHLVDVSSRALDQARTTLSSLDGVRIVAHTREYEVGLRELAAHRKKVSGHTLVLFLGSNLGNFDPPAAVVLLDSIRANLSAGDAVLLGTDLIKPEADLVLAYDDPLGVTAAFNRNLLVRINRDLAGDFDIAQFGHQALWNATDSRVEMHLVARCRQRVLISAVPMTLTFEAGERIWTESSYKYRPEGVAQMLNAAGFHTTAQWIDAGDAFALTLCRVG